MGTGADLLTRPEAARALRVSVPTIDRLRAAGALAEVVIGRRVLVPLAEVERLAAGRRRDVCQVAGVDVTGPLW
ncbi:MAG: helix-turn-helix domain-containing protein [Acidimicrobiales bacterium]